MSEKLLESAVVQITAKDDLVWTVVENRDDVGPDEGAECARLMAEVLLAEVLIAGSPHRGVLVDVRRGPDVFGPQTRNRMESVLRAAEQHRVPVAIVVAGLTQRMQFDSMAGIYAPSVSRVTTDEKQALELIDSLAPPR